MHKASKHYLTYACMHMLGERTYKMHIFIITKSDQLTEVDAAAYIQVLQIQACIIRRRVCTIRE